MSEIYSVSDLNQTLRYLIDTQPTLKDTWVQGEVSNFTAARSGHWYFTLKDANAAIRCVMWKSDAARQDVRPQEGDQIAIHGQVGFYEARGDLQFYADFVRPVGIGDLYAEFERLKAALEAEGMFDPIHKKLLPTFPTRIGVVTSADAAAFQDVQNVLRRRFPLAEVILSPTLVQGVQAPPMIRDALTRLDQSQTVDVILLVRGGGSIEDLWAFNDAGLAQAVFEARTPIVTGVGHETDFTIVDFVADTRAPTPSAAAEVATPDLSTLVATLHDQRQRLRITLDDRLRNQREDVRDITRTLTLLSPASDIRNYRQRLDDLRTGIDRQQTYSLQRQRERLQAQVAALHAASPQAILQRGYAFVTDAQGNPVQQVTDTTVGDPINIHLQDGTLAATVTDRNEAS